MSRYAWTATLVALILPLCALAGGEAAKPTNPYFDDPSGVAWETGYDRALALAAAGGRPVFVLMTRTNCPNTFFFCKQVLTSAAIRERLKKSFVPLLLPLETDKDTPPPGVDAKELEHDLKLKKVVIAEALKSAPGAYPPFLLLLAPNGEVIAARAGLIDDKVFTEFLDLDPRAKPAAGDKKR